MHRSLRLVPLALVLACNGGGSSDDTDTDTDEPVIATATISPQAPCSNEDLVVEVGGGRATAYRWTVDGASSPETTDRIASNRTTKGQLWAVEVDVEGAAAPASASVTVVNCGPTVTGVALTPADPTRLDAIVGEVEASDPDDDTLTITWRWLVDGDAVNGADTDTLEPGPFRKGQQVIAEVVVSDGELSSAAVQSAPITVVNTAPTAAGVALDPEEPLTGDDLVCIIDAPSFDVDDDAVTYAFAWTVDGAAFSAATTTVYPGDTVPASATEPEQVWECTVTPSDGEDFGPAATVDVTIGSWADVTFSTCGHSGRTGPSQSLCDGAYRATPLAGLVTVVSGLQTWTVPATGTYVITAYGAEGGEQTAAANKGGRGAVIRAKLELTAGETLQILVGQRGGDGNRGTSNGAAAGGGASGIADGAGRPLLVAGGGGGGDHDCGGEKTGGDGRMSTSGGDGSPSGQVGRGGTNGNGGSHPTSHTGGGGAGYYANGQAAGGREGLAPGNGGLGGIANDGTNTGGFGGGGGTGSQSAGGGGGYSGGGASENCYAGIAGGGGGSFVTASAIEVWTSDGTFSRTGAEPDSAWSGSVGRLDLWQTGQGQVMITR